MNMPLYNLTFLESLREVWEGKGHAFICIFIGTMTVTKCYIFLNLWNLDKKPWNHEFDFSVVKEMIEVDSEIENIGDAV